ncbi:beta/gamma crystallin-related protein [Niveispirillum fermenti]|uniref:beta/gamma crystallin-related protein n=1 Tax=Niveispirillum fermenti TaxID=1233113 RepID=UPI003A83DA6F
MKRWLAALAAMGSMLVAGQVLAGSVTLYSQPGFRGDRITITRDVDSLTKLPPWNDRARSLVVHSGTWEICKNKRYDDCRTLVGGARVADTAEVKYLRGGITSLREVGRSQPRDDGRGHDHWAWNPPPGPPPPPPRHRDDDIIWNGPGGGAAGPVSSRPQNACQTQVERAFQQRYGFRARTEFSGSSVEGTIWWDGQPWRYRCAGGQTNIWR